MKNFRQKLIHSFRKSRFGQISVLIVFSLIPLFTLLGFVVNLGVLVNAKISLQNAADMAAYAGAATQARQLTGISHLNYMMRQAYKKFLFRYYVLGNFALRCFPRDGQPLPAGCPAIQDDAPFDWINYKSNGGSTGFPSVPAICLEVSTSSNPCQVSESVPLVTPPTCAPLNPACAALNDAATAIQDLQRASCGAHKLMNLEIALHWLYSTSDDDLVTQPSLSNIAKGIGLVPENLFHYSRIQSLQKYLNSTPKTVTATTIKSFEEVTDISSTERTVQAFKTIQGNLNSHVFNDQNSIVMKELQPPGMLQLTTINPKLDIPSVTFESGGATCQLGIIVTNAQPILGVYKKGQLTDNSDIFYAIKVTAKARLLFNPFPFNNPDPTGIELVAYSAAKPFGSRIGPQLDESQFYKKGKIKDNTGSSVDVNYPYLSISNTDPAKPIDYQTSGVLKNLGKMISLTALAAGGTGAATAVGFQDVIRGYQASMLPDEIEVGQYNIPSDAEVMANPTALNKGMVRYFQTAKNTYNYDYLAENKFYQLWAPLIEVGQPFTILKDKIKSEVENHVSFNTTGSAGGGAVGDLKAGMAEFLLSKLDNLFTTMQQKNNFNIAHIYDPLALDYYEQNPNNIPNIPGKQKGRESISLLASSYTTPNDATYYVTGRDGYSVKFIPFKDALSAAPSHDFKSEKSELQKLPF